MNEGSRSLIWTRLPYPVLDLRLPAFVVLLCCELGLGWAIWAHSQHLPLFVALLVVVLIGYASLAPVLRPGLDLGVATDGRLMVLKSPMWRRAHAIGADAPLYHRLGWYAMQGGRWLLIGLDDEQESATLLHMLPAEGEQLIRQYMVGAGIPNQTIDRIAWYAPRAAGDDEVPAGHVVHLDEPAAVVHGAAATGEWVEFPSRGPDVRLFSFVIAAMVGALALWFLLFGPSIQGFARSNDFWLVAILVSSPLIGTACFLFALHAPPFVLRVAPAGGIYLAKLHWVPWKKIQQEFGPFERLCWFPQSDPKVTGNQTGGDTMLHRVWLGGIRLQPPQAERIYGTSDANVAVCRKFLAEQGIPVIDVQQPSQLGELFVEAPMGMAAHSTIGVDTVLQWRARLRVAGQAAIATLATCAGLVFVLMNTSAASGRAGFSGFAWVLVPALIGISLTISGVIRSGTGPRLDIRADKLRISPDFTWKSALSPRRRPSVTLADAALTFGDKHTRWILVSVTNRRTGAKVVQVHWHVTRMPELILLCRHWGIPWSWDV